jgi:hypothetical protein
MVGCSLLIKTGHPTDHCIGNSIEGWVLVRRPYEMDILNGK